MVVDGLAVVEAFGVAGEEDFDAVAGALGDFGGVGSCCEPGGQGGVAQVVGAFGEWDGGEFGWQCEGAGIFPGAVDGGVAQDGAAFGEEQPPVGCGAEGLDAVAPDGDQVGWEGDDADFARRSALQAAVVVHLAAVGPFPACLPAGGRVRCRTSEPQPVRGRVQSARVTATASPVHMPTNSPTSRRLRARL